jgi:sigma-B regulation protein RsbU (phosphoserine phosphatase)
MVPELEERVKIKQALDVAMEVQQNLLPQSAPKIEGLDIAGRSIYCDETGGDLYDFLEVCHRGSDRIGLAVGDVSGHGISAALLMASARAFLRSRATQPGKASEIVTDVGRLLTSDTRDTGQFVTLFYAEIVPPERTLTWVRAGHDPALFYDPTPNKCSELQGKGVALGIDENIEYQENIQTDLKKGQILLIGTDGLWETLNKSGEMFGKERLKSLVREHQHLSSEALIQLIIDSLNVFRGSFKQEDDITLVVVKIVD